jgi:hypothetical protein
MAGGRFRKSNPEKLFCKVFGLYYAKQSVHWHGRVKLREGHEPTLVEMEIDFNIDQNSDWNSILAAGFKLPLSNCFDGLLIQTHA